MRRMTVLISSVALLAALGVVIMPATAASAATGSKVVYDSIPSPLPGNMPSEGPEAYAFNEFGNQIRFSGTTVRLGAVMVTMSDWACQFGHWYNDTCFTNPGATFFEPVALNIYHAPTSGTFPRPGSLIASVSQTFAIPYRPSDDIVNCAGDGWFDAAADTCYHGLATNITFH